MKYLRGEAVSGYRYRSQKLGVIVNSAPVFLDDVIYAGSNDGMLHALDAGTGAEIFAYVPNLVFGNLNPLTEPGYTHRFYVDLTPTVKKGKSVLADGTTSTLLVGGLRNGGKGYFGLNVTNSKSITTETELATRVLWEFPKTSDPDMGYSFSKPVIVKSNSTAHPWVVILWLAPLVLLLAWGHDDLRASPVDGLFFALAVPLWFGHRISSAWLAYATPAYRPLLAKQRLRFVVAPLAIAVTCFALLLAPESVLPMPLDERVVGLAILNYLLGSYHFAAQHFGLLTLYPRAFRASIRSARATTRSLVRAGRGRRLRGCGRGGGRIDRFPGALD